MTGLTFLIMFLLLITLASFVPQFLKKFHIPAVISMMIVGVAIGPNGLDLVGLLNHFLGRGYPTEQLYTVLDAMGMLGLVFLMALAGMEVNLKILMAEKKAVAMLSILTFAVPAVAGYYAYGFFMPQDTIGKWVYASLFASHSVGIVFPIIRELKVVRTRFGVSVLASTVITDLASLILFAICVQFQRHKITATVDDSISLFDHINPAFMGFWFIMTFILVIVIYIFLALWLVPKAAKYFLEKLHPQDDMRVTFFLSCVLIVVFIGELIGVSIIVGAFIAGMAVVMAPAFHDRGRILHKKIEGVGHGFLIPFLFLTIGMKTDLRILFSAWENAAIVVVTVLALVFSKVGSGWLALRLAGFENKKSLCAGLMTVPQLSATLAAAAVALKLQMIGEEFFNAIVCLSIVTTIPVPTLVKLLIIKGKIRFNQIDDKLAAELPESEDVDIDEELV